MHRNMDTYANIAGACYIIISGKDNLRDAALNSDNTDLKVWEDQSL